MMTKKQLNSFLRADHLWPSNWTAFQSPGMVKALLCVLTSDQELCSTRGGRKSSFYFWTVLFLMNQVCTRATTKAEGTWQLPAVHSVGSRKSWTLLQTSSLLSAAGKWSPWTRLHGLSLAITPPYACLPTPDLTRALCSTSEEAAEFTI